MNAGNMTIKSKYCTFPVHAADLWQVALAVNWFPGRSYVRNGSVMG